MESKPYEALREALLESLSREELAALDGKVPRTEPSDYDSAFAGVRRRLAGLGREVSRNRNRVRERYPNLEAEPEGRRRTLFANSPPSLLVALARSLMERSYAERFFDVGRSLELAKMAVEVATRLARDDYLATDQSADLRAEALVHLGNALRINSDLSGAETAFDEAESLRTHGSRDRQLHADLLRHLGLLRIDQGRAPEGGELMDREIAIRRLLANREELGVALINRGVLSAWYEPLGRCCDFLRAGVALVEEPRMMLLALFPLGEALARSGDGLGAWKVACQTDVVMILAGAEDLRVRNQAIKGIALRVLGELDDAERELAATLEEFSRQGRKLQAAVAALDLACVYAAQGRTRDVAKLVRCAQPVFEREKLEKELTRAFETLEQAVRTESLSEQLLVEVVNFVVSFQQNRKLQFAVQL